MGAFTAAQCQAKKVRVMTERDERIHNQTRLKAVRRLLRNNATPAEAELWRFLQKSQLAGRKFRRQHSTGPYIVDFYCPAEKLVVELDGASHDDPLRTSHDEEREAYLRDQGVRVLRFENMDVFEQPDNVLQTIAQHLQT